MTGLDNESELMIRDAMSHLMVGKTCLLVTHNLNALREVDRVLVIEKGRVIVQKTEKYKSQRQTLESNSGLKEPLIKS